MEFGEKIGNFDWIVPYASLKKFLEPEFTGLAPDKAVQKALVIGCGTSELSALLAEESLFGQVVSVDNDAGCIEHMKTQASGKPQLQWLVYDCIEAPCNGVDVFRITEPFIMSTLHSPQTTNITNK
jgi:16S rRNA A1518/A1519 N6-dimethyltransferase RsmA/KsgA/DIM1 with predicted DNA glycosylase/AP lyase activity